MDVEKLIERLYKHDKDYGEGRTQDFFRVCLDCKDAATALSTLQAENSRLRAELEYEREHADAYYEECGQWEAENEKLRAELEQVKAERDEAVQCIRGIAKSGRVWMCPYCVHAKDTTGGIAECELDVGVCMMPYSKFEWRDQKEDGKWHSFTK